MEARTLVDREDLLQHAAWIRRLAVELVFDPARVDDVVQDTWLEVLEREPGGIRELRAWLPSVVRNAARKIGRSESARRKRERTVASSESGPDTNDVEERARLHRDLVDHVLALDEPYRGVLLARFFDGIAPREIAKQRGVPDATVKSWIQRGLERLRKRLDERFGDREAWGMALLPLAKVPTGAVVALAASAGILAFLSQPLVTLCGGLAVAIGGVGWWSTRANETEPVRPKAAITAPSPHAELQTSPEVASAPTQPSETRASAAPVSSPPHIRVIESDQSLAPLGTRVRWMALDHEERGEGTTDKDGRVVLPRAGEFLVLAEPAIGFVACDVVRVTESGATITLPPSGALTVRFVDDAGHGVAGVVADLDTTEASLPPTFGGSWCGAIAEILAGKRAFSAKAIADVRAALASRDTPPVSKSVASNVLMQAWKPIATHRTSDVDGSIDWPALPADGAYAVDVVSDHLLALPMKRDGVNIDAEGHTSFGGGSSRTDSGLPELNYSNRFAVSVGSRTIVPLILEAGAIVSGKMRVKDHGPMPPLELVHKYGFGNVNFTDTTARVTPDPDGHFVFRAVRSGTNALRAAWTRDDSEWWLLDRHVDAKPREQIDLGVVEPSDEPRCKLRIAFRTHEGLEVSPAEVLAVDPPRVKAEFWQGLDLDARIAVAPGRDLTLHGFAAGNLFVSTDPFTSRAPKLRPGWTLSELNPQSSLTVPKAETIELALIVGRLAHTTIVLDAPADVDEMPDQLIAFQDEAKQPVPIYLHAIGRTEFKTEAEAGTYHLWSTNGRATAKSPTGWSVDAQLVIVPDARFVVPVQRGSSIVVEHPSSLARSAWIGATPTANVRPNSISSLWSSERTDDTHSTFVGLPPDTEFVVWRKSALDGVHVTTGAPGSTITAHVD